MSRPLLYTALRSPGRGLGVRKWEEEELREKWAVGSSARAPWEPIAPPPPPPMTGFYRKYRTLNLRNHRNFSMFPLQHTFGVEGEFESLLISCNMGTNMGGIS